MNSSAGLTARMHDAERARRSRWRGTALFRFALHLSSFAFVLAMCGQGARAMQSLDEELQRFVADLRSFREGDENALARLHVLTESLCDTYDRCDARAVLGHYQKLSPAERRQGLIDEEAFRALWQRVRDAGQSGLVGDEWQAERSTILADLSLLADAASTRADFVPAAQAWSLCARIEIEALETENDAQRGAEIAREAERHTRLALELFERAGQQTPQLEPLWLLGRLAASRASPREARANYEACLNRAIKVRREDFRENALQGLLALARAAGDTREQDRRLEELARFRDPRSNWPLARDWAARLLQRDFAEQAVSFLERHPPADDAPVRDRFEFELLLGSAQLRAGNGEAARELFETLSQRVQSELAVLALAALALSEERAFEALVLLDDAAIERFSPAGRERGLALQGEALYASGDFEGAAERLRSAFDAARERERAWLPEESDAVAGAAVGIIGERLGLHTVALLADTLARLGRPLEAACVIEEAQARTLRRSPREAAAPLEIEALRVWAARHELGVLTWVVGADFSVVAHVAPDGSAECARIEQGRDRIEQAARRLREAALARGSATSLRRLGAEITQVLIPPAIAARLTRAAALASDEPRLLVLAHGPIETLPLELLEWNTLFGRVDFALAVLPGLVASDPGPELDRANLAAWILTGAPLDANGRDVLAGARDELATLKTMHDDAETAIGADFTRERLLAALRTRRPVHIATHLASSCDTAVDLARAGLVTSDAATLCADEIAAANPELPLVVLAACWSGGGEFVDAEGLFGLARVFLAHGTRHVLVTQWPIEDASAAAFGCAYHRALKSGASPSRAAARARRELEAAGVQPADFAAFRALGRD